MELELLKFTYELPLLGAELGSAVVPWKRKRKIVKPARSLNRNNWKALPFLYCNVSTVALPARGPTLYAPAFVCTQATCRQKATPFLLGELSRHSVVADPCDQQAELPERGWAASREGEDQGHIRFQMTEQQFIYQLAFLHEEEK